jgi:hypothetical protein
MAGRCGAHPCCITRIRCAGLAGPATLMSERIESLTLELHNHIMESKGD